MEVELRLTCLNPGRFPHELVIVKDEVRETETVSEAIERLRTAAAGTAGLEDLIHERTQFQYDIAQLEAKIKETKKEWNNLSLFLSAQGIQNAGLIPIPGLPKLIEAAERKIPGSKDEIEADDDDDNCPDYEDDDDDDDYGH